MPLKQGPGPAKRSTPGTLAVAGADASSGLVPWHEDFVFEGVKASERVTVTCFLHRRSLASSGAGGGDALGESGGKFYLLFQPAELMIDVHA